MAAQQTGIPIDVLEMAARVLRVLAHPHRLKMVELLEQGRKTVGQLAGMLDLAPSAVSQHLNQMRAHGILEVERQGREAYYHVVNPNARNVLECIRQHGCGRSS